jgi:hypothetical protein
MMGALELVDPVRAQAARRLVRSNLCRRRRRVAEALRRLAADAKVVHAPSSFFRLLDLDYSQLTLRSGLIFILFAVRAPRLGVTGPGHSRRHAETRQHPTHQDNVRSKKRNEP